MIDITAAPFNLDTKAAEWVQTTLAGMDLRAKVGQLFHLVCRANDAEGIRAVLGRSEFVGTSPVDPFCGYSDTHL